MTDAEAHWSITNARWTPGDIDKRWYRPSTQMMRPIPHDIILCDGTYWLIGGNDQECTGERLGPYADFASACLAAEMLAEIDCG